MDLQSKSVKGKTIKLLELNIGEYHFNISEAGKNFLSDTKNSLTIKRKDNKLDYIKIKDACSLKKTHTI